MAALLVALLVCRPTPAPAAPPERGTAVRPAVKPKPGLQPQLLQCTLDVGGQQLEPVRTASPGPVEYRVGGLTVRLEKDRVIGQKGSGAPPAWTAQAPDKHHLEWLAHDGGTAYLQGYQVDADGRFERYSDRVRVRRLDLRTGRWLPDLPAGVGGLKGYKSESVLGVLAGDGYVAVLHTLVKPPPKEDGEASIAFAVTGYAVGQATPLWVKTFPAAGRRPGPGVYLLAARIPNYPTSDICHLTWLGDTLLVCAEAVQPVRCLNPDTGTVLWQIERPWEYERGFIGPSVWRHFIDRFGIGEYEQDPDKVARARRRFDRRYECAIIGGPAVVRRDDGSHRVYIAVAKAPRTAMGDYVADCIVYEFGDRGRPVSLVKVPQTVRGALFHTDQDGVVWACQNEGWLRMATTPNTEADDGPGGPDLITRVPWFRQPAMAEPKAWLVADKAGDPVAFGERWAFRLPAGGHVDAAHGTTYHFPISATNVQTGEERQAVLHVPFLGTLTEPNVNCSRTEAPDGSVKIHTMGPYVLAVTGLRLDGPRLGVALGMEGWSALVEFDVGKAIDLRAASAATDPSAPARWVRAFGHVNAPDKQGQTPLHRAARLADARYTKALLAAGADVRARFRGWTALMVAAMYGTAEVVQVLADAGADVNARDTHGITVLMYAAGSEREARRKVQILLRAGADAKAQAANGYNALFAAAQYEGQLAALEYLLAHGADVRQRQKGGTTLLMAAAAQDGTPTLLSVLIQAGADVNARYREGRTALMHAANGYGTAEAIQVLLAAGADPRARDRHGRTALDVARASNSIRSAERAKALAAAGQPAKK